MCNKSKLDNLRIKLPSKDTQPDQPDWQFMEDFIEKTKRDVVKNLNKLNLMH